MKDDAYEGLDTIQEIKRMGSFEDELGAVINRYSQEQASNTPDFILAQYLIGCLAAWNTAVQQRETWYGRDARPCHIEERLGLADRT